MVNYKRYLYSNEKIPQRTLSRQRRKEAEERRKEAEERLRSLQNNQVQTIQDQRTRDVLSGVNATMTGSVMNFDKTDLALCNTESYSSINETQPTCGHSDHLASVAQSVLDESLATETTTWHAEESALDVPSFDFITQSDSTPFCNADQHSNSSDETQAHQVPLCSHTECTEGDVMLMCLAIGFRHNLTWAAQVDVLKMINVIYGQEKIQATKYGYLKELQNNENLSVTYHVYCPTCDNYIGKKDNLKMNVHCDNCNGDFDVSKSTNFFISLSLKSQLQKLVEDPVLALHILNYRFNRPKENTEALEDIYDGSEYKNHSAAGQILSSPQNFSYSFFTDGVPLGKSAKKTLWPIYITINELPPKERSKHVLLCGLYVGAHDPNQNVFMKPFVEEANMLSTSGFTWSHNGQEIISKVIPLIAIADSVARCQLLNFQSFHAYYGCTFCYQKQTRTVRRLKFTLPSKQVEERTIISTQQDLQQVFENRYESKDADRHSRGVKGPSALMQLYYFNFIYGVVVDYMHCILVGVVKTHSELLLDSMRRKCCKYLSDEVLAMDDLLSDIDRRLLSVKPPSSISRTPRSFKEWKLWKASEWRSWLLFYCIPCLSGLLKKKIPYPYCHVIKSY